MIRGVLAFLLCLLAMPAASASEADTTVYFLNIAPGAQIYELEGHSAIAVDIKGQQPRVYNFGVFDFDAPNFVYRFVKGETDYMAVCQPMEPFVRYYRSCGRKISAHELALDPAQKRRLLDLLETNVLPQNRTYRYNYVKDNCATRPLRAVELALGDSIILGPAPFEANSFPRHTFRNIMRHYHANYPWYQFGIDLALGPGIDYELSRREMAFAPAELDGMLPAARAGGKPVVRKSFELSGYDVSDPREAPTPWYAAPGFVCWAFFAFTLVLTLRDIRRRKVTRWFDCAYFALLGLTGCLLAFLIFVSVHEATSPNWLFAWLNPLCLIPAVFIWIKKAKAFLMCYQITNFAVLLALCACWYFLPQSANPAFAPLIGAEMLRSFSYILISRYKK